jgi:protein-disulfide isomerase
VSTTLHAPRLTVPVGPEDHVVGPATAPVTLVEYGDYECPFCGAAHRSLATVLPAAGDEVRYVFRHFPLSQIHPHALSAAEAAEAAGAQGRFWEMHDLLFQNQHRLAARDLLGYATELRLDTERFLTDLAGHAHEERIRRDFMSGIRSGVNGTPTFFVNGVRHNGDFEPTTLLAAIRAAA